MKKLTAILTLGMVLVGAVGSAKADDCTATLKNHFDWVAANARNFVSFKLTSNSTSYASFTEGALDSSSTSPAVISGSAYQYFSDRRYPCTGICYPISPFYDGAKDTLGVQLTRDGKMTFILHSWGGGIITVPGLCIDGHVYGVYGGALFTLSLSNDAAEVVH